MSRPKIYTEEQYRQRRRESARNWGRRNKAHVIANSIKWAKENPNKVKQNRDKTFSKFKNQSYFRLRRLYYLIIERCYNQNNKSYQRYGGRGISVCEEWLNGREKFIEWALNNGYEIGLSIDRINNNGNYKPDNCKFSTNKEQCNNTRRNVFIEYMGEIKTLTQWAEYYNIQRATLWWRNKQGHPPEKMFSSSHLQSNKPLKLIDDYLNNKL